MYKLNTNSNNEIVTSIINNILTNSLINLNYILLKPILNQLFLLNSITMSYFADCHSKNNVYLESDNNDRKNKTIFNKDI